MIGKAEEGCSNHSPRYRILFICVPAVLYLKLRSMYYVLPLLLSTFAIDKSITNLFIFTQICK